MLLLKLRLLLRIIAQLKPLPVILQEIYNLPMIFLQPIPKENLVLLQIDPYLLIHRPQLDFYHIFALKGVGFYCVQLASTLFHASEYILSLLSRGVIVT